MDLFQSHQRVNQTHLARSLYPSQHAGTESSNTVTSGRLQQAQTGRPNYQSNHPNGHDSNHPRRHQSYFGHQSSHDYNGHQGQPKTDFVNDGALYRQPHDQHRSHGYHDRVDMMRDGGLHPQTHQSQPALSASRPQQKPVRKEVNPVISKLTNNSK